MTVDKEQRTPRKRRTARCIRYTVALLAVFLCGYLAAQLQESWETKMLQVAEGSTFEKTQTILSICKDIGLRHFSSCEKKVNDLHQEIANSDPEDWSDEVGILVSSIFIDGNDCNPYLAQHAESETVIPHARQMGGFRHLRMLEDIRNVATTEGELVIWLLDRINPRHRLTFFQAEGTRETDGNTYANSMLKVYWVAVARGEFD